ncbi:MAG TPA: GNAT family N-acetyltransferase [Anaerolineales bacterium]|nr:GNAT family N-acetyltransferase [Anaerolineales bacterium]
MIRIRPYESADHDFVLGLAPRLAIGMRQWRDRGQWLKAVEGWLTDSLAAHPTKSWAVIAVDERGERLGFASVTSNEHFTGQRQAYIGELASTEASEGCRVGRALVAACEEWARSSGHRLITLTTGGGNERALGFYRHLGYIDEDVSLTKEL